MYDNHSILALIPARGGSKGVPRKNIREMAGIPLIAWTINEAKKSKYADKLVVSTDDQEIIRIANQYGAETPFLRPTELATDSAKGIDVVIHAMEWHQAHGEKFDFLLLLQPTSPLRTVDDIDQAIEFLFKNKAMSVVSVCETDHHPWHCNSLPESLCMKDFYSVNLKNKNRQEFPKFYRMNGALYFAECEYIKKNRHFIGDETYAFIMPKRSSLDIDDEIDFRLAELLLEEKRKSMKNKE